METLFEISEENGNHGYMYIGGDMIYAFSIKDKIYEYISNMGKKSTPYSILIDE